MNLHSVFTSQFGGEAPHALRSPGRVNLIGEHVDYNCGFVLPMAVSLQTDMVFRPRDDRSVALYSPLFDAKSEFSLDHLERGHGWIDYAQAVAWVMQSEGVELRGFEGAVSSDIPLASGLSSSASFEVAVALAFLELAGVSKSRAEIALLCQRAENEFIGVNCGIMDQMAVAACVAHHALLLDCRTNAIRHVPFQLRDHALVVIDSAAPRELASSAYNARRAQCEQGLALLRKWVPDAHSLRDISPQQLAAHKHDLPEEVARRVSHVVGEIARTLDAVSALEGGDLTRFGALMNESHASLRDLYEVTSMELDFLTDWARKQPGVLGSRMTGAGFGGCTVTLMERAGAEQFIARLQHDYAIATDREARGWVCEAQDGAQVLE